MKIFISITLILCVAGCTYNSELTPLSPDDSILVNSHNGGLLVQFIGISPDWNLDHSKSSITHESEGAINYKTKKHKFIAEQGVLAYEIKTDQFRLTEGIYTVKMVIVKKGAKKIYNQKYDLKSKFIFFPFLQYIYETITQRKEMCPEKNI